MLLGNKENALQGAACILYKTMYVFLAALLNLDLSASSRHTFSNKKEGKHINI